MGGQQQVTNFKVKVKIFDPPKRIRPGMSSTVNIISETIKNTISIPIQALTSRPENYQKLMMKRWHISFPHLIMTINFLI